MARKKITGERKLALSYLAERKQPSKPKTPAACAGNAKLKIPMLLQRLRAASFFLLQPAGASRRAGCSYLSLYTKKYAERSRLKAAKKPAGPMATAYRKPEAIWKRPSGWRSLKAAYISAYKAPAHKALTLCAGCWLLPKPASAVTGGWPAWRFYAGWRLAGGCWLQMPAAEMAA